MKRIFTIGITLCLALVPVLTGCSSSKEPSKKKTSSAQLSQYQEDSIESVVNNAINKEYGVGNYNYVDFDNMRLIFDGDIITVKTTATIKDGGTAYDVPAEFDLEYQPSSGRYELTYSSFDDDHKKTVSTQEDNDNKTASTLNKDDKKQDIGKNTSFKNDGTKKENPDLVGLSKSEDEFEINVGSSITVESKVPAGARVVTVAIDEDGNEIVVSDADGEDKTETTEVPAGKYKITAYYSGGGWNWSFSCN